MKEHRLVAGELNAENIGLMRESKSGKHARIFTIYNPPGIFSVTRRSTIYGGYAARTKEWVMHVKFWKEPPKEREYLRASC
jgi:hypothetical protein